MKEVADKSPSKEVSELSNWRSGASPNKNKNLHLRSGSDLQIYSGPVGTGPDLSGGGPCRVRLHPSDGVEVQGVVVNNGGYVITPGPAQFDSSYVPIFLSNAS